MVQSSFSTIGKIGIGVGIAIAGGVVNASLYNVKEGHRAVIFDRFSGVQQTVVGEGRHFLVPWVQHPIFFDIRPRSRSIAASTRSKDLQTVNATVRILFRPQATMLPKIFLNFGPDYDERILPSITNEVLKAIVAQFDASEVITQRELLSQTFSKELTQRAAKYWIILDDISLVQA